MDTDISETIDQLLETIPDRKENRLVVGLSSSDIDQLINSLKKIQDLVNNHNQRQEVLSNLKTALNVLNELVAELSAGIPKPQKRAFSLFQADRHKNQLKSINSRIQKVIKDLEDVLKELSKTTTTRATMPPQEAWEKTGEETELEPAIVGRKNEIIDQLIPLHAGAESVGKVSMVSIVGFAGIGKTKLARLICEDEQVKAYFGLQIWIYDVEFLNTTDMSSTYTDGGKGNLVVLDNLKTEILGDKMLSDLDKILKTSKGASAILITTRSKLVANNITVSLSNYRLGHVTTRPDTIFTTFKPHVIPGLNEEESFSLFWKVRGQSSSIFDAKKEMQRKMVMDCGGVPFLIIFIAMFLNNHGADLNKEEFLKELKVKYYDKLPSPQKFCFEFCSLFPQDHLIDVERLIHLLTAEGFQSDLENTEDPFQKKENTEDKFRQYFNDFVGMPIFKDMEEDECGAVRRCRMQPLMHDLARLVSDQKENVTVDPEGEKVTEGVLRASFDFSLDVSRGIPLSLFKKAKKLRAILFWKTQSLLSKDMKTGYSTCGQIFKTFKATLRMLDLHDMGIKTLPNSIGDMNNLRYLDLSLNSIEKLPNSITKLSNLQTLKLSRCYLLEELPKNIDELVNLKHLEIDGCLALTHMPRKLHKLENSLQTLSLFVISEGHHVGGLGELARLNNLRGHLEISHLESLNLSKEENYLKGKIYLQRLTLRWCHEDDSGKEEDDQKRLGCLEPPSTLKAIFVVGYKGKTLSNWFSSIACLVKLSLYDCRSCIFLPHLDELPNLRFLELLRLDKLEYIADQSNDSDCHNDKLQATAVHFPSLEELTISDCPNLKRWWKKDKIEKDLPFFACLSKLNVNYCPELTCMPLFPSLDEELILVGSSVKPLLDSIAHGHRKCCPFSKLKSMKIANIEDSRSPPKIRIEYFNSLEKLDIKEWKHLESLGFDNLSSLQSLNIENCQELDLSSTEWEGLKNLRSLTISEIPKLETLPLGIYKVTSLQDLQFHNCPRLTSLDKTIDNLKSLEKLVISECDKLASLPKALKNVESLHTLIILDCTLLLPRCQPDTGDDWPQIAHIKNKQVTETNRDM